MYYYHMREERERMDPEEQVRNGDNKDPQSLLQLLPWLEYAAPSVLPSKPSRLPVVRAEAISVCHRTGSKNAKGRERNQ